jgi:hypothetical protein
MKQKGSALIIILILILLTVIGFFVYRDYLSPKGTILGPFVPSPTATADPAADWKTYTNNYWEISLKYPQDKLTPCPSYTTESEGIRFFSFGFNCPNGTDVTYKVGVVGYKPGQYKEVKAPSTSQPVAVGGKTATRKMYIYDESDGPLFGQKESQEVVFNLDKGTLVLQQWGDNLNDKQIFDQILSTFKFTDSATSGPKVTSPVSNSKVASPLTVTGTVPAGWMFEGVFPIKLVDANQKLIVQGQAKETIAGSWQSGKPIDFSATLIFKGATGSGNLILENDNPSGDPEKAQTFEVPVNLQ